MTSPPVVSDNIDLSLLEGHDLLYIRLHGIDGQPYLYSDPGWYTAITAEQIKSLNLAGTHVFLEGCNGIFLDDAFLQAGAKSVTGALASTWGRRIFLAPASKVGRRFIKRIEKSGDPDSALKGAMKVKGLKPDEKWKVVQNGKSTEVV